MTKREKQRDLFIELINYQLKDHNVTYDDVRENPSWYMEYHTTHEKETEFIQYCISRIMKVLKVSKAEAERETSWFILQWGLTMSTSLKSSKESEEIESKSNKKTKG